MKTKIKNNITKKHIKQWQAQADGARKANKNKILSRKHKMRIRKGLKTAIRNQIIKAVKEDDIRFYTSMSDCARDLGCSRQLISQCIKRPNVFKSAMGFRIDVVEKENA